EYLNYAQTLAGRAPDHPGVIYAVARGFALVGQPAAALRWLGRLADIGAGPDVDSDSVFAGLNSSTEFRAVRARLQRNRAPLVRGAPASTPPDPDLPPQAPPRPPLTGARLLARLSRPK